MKLYLTPDLQAHRRGRFLSSLLSIPESTEHGLPSAGFVLMTGEALQASRETQEECAAWVRQPGCSLLLLPPYREGRVFNFLDWTVELASANPPAAKQASLVNMLAGELTYSLRGIDGASTEDVLSGDLSCHTRYWKAHSNSGLLAATTLPIWSISLLDQAGLVQDYLAAIDRHCGLPSVNEQSAAQQDCDAIRPEDLTVLVCCYGFGVATAEDLLIKLKAYAVPMLNLAAFDLHASMMRLGDAGLIGAQSLTEHGETYLMGSKFWAFAERLRNEA